MESYMPLVYRASRRYIEKMANKEFFTLHYSRVALSRQLIQDAKRQMERAKTHLRDAQHLRVTKMDNIRHS